MKTRTRPATGIAFIEFGVGKVIYVPSKNPIISNWLFANWQTCWPEATGITIIDTDDFRYTSLMARAKETK